jgi:hypothetical protein
MNSIINRLLGMVLGEVNEKVWSTTSEGNLSKPIADKIKLYKNGFKTNAIWTNSTYDMLAIIASLDLLKDNKLKSLFRISDQYSLQIEYGVNAFSKEATTSALAKMKFDYKNLQVLKEYCEGIDRAAKLLVAKQTALGITNTSNILFEKAGYDQVRLLYQKITTVLDRRLRLLEIIIKSNTDVLRFHKRQPNVMQPSSQSFRHR